MRLDKRRYTVIGVTPPGFGHISCVLSPMVMQGQDVLNTRSNHSIAEVFGHLRPGVTPAQAVADLNAISSWLQKTYPKEDR